MIKKVLPFAVGESHSLESANPLTPAAFLGSTGMVSLEPAILPIAWPIAWGVEEVLKALIILALGLATGAEAEKAAHTLADTRTGQATRGGSGVVQNESIDEDIETLKGSASPSKTPRKKY